MGRANHTSRIEGFWYRPSLLAWALSPLGTLFAAVAVTRRRLYEKGVFRVQRVSVPVVVVGNITVGGTGKTPLVIWLAEFLKRNGYRPGIVSRGYGGDADTWPQRVSATSDPRRVGDEAVLIARRSGCPMMAGPNRAEAAQALLAADACDLIISDDGLQHYALGRDLEIAVVDGMRRFGNGFCLPVGPLREPVSRLGSVDLVVCNGRPQGREFAMTLEGVTAVNLADGERRRLDAFAGQQCHAVAGIGNPHRFFRHLEGFGLTFDTRVFPDHYVYNEKDFRFRDARPVLMTEKDAVKCGEFADARLWYVPVQARMADGFGSRLLTLLQEKVNGQ